MIGPNIEKLAEENADATVIKIDVDKHPEITTVYGVQTIPTLIAFKKDRL
ncbi:MAG: thioredoxin family protein [Turicibacter sp.]